MARPKGRSESLSNLSTFLDINSFSALRYSWERLPKLSTLGGLSRKHVIEGTGDSLKRLGYDYIDVIFCHRPDD